MFLTVIIPTLFLSTVNIVFAQDPITSSSDLAWITALEDTAPTTSYDSSSPLVTTQSSSSHNPLTALVGTQVGNTTQNVTSSATTSSHPRQTNTQPCNGYVDFCNRKLSNISVVVAHNSPFVVPHNAASNQDLPVLTQLNDGIRGLQFETHMLNNTLQLCHTNCNLLNAGTLEAYLRTVAGWLASNPYEVITIMMGNDARVAASTYIQPFQDAGLLPYLYIPKTANATLDEWPTLSEMIIQNKRVVVMLDYLADQAQVPWLLDEFAYQWQTPFSPTNPAFPCTQQRPPGQTDSVSRNKMYMVNHNLNINIDGIIPGVSSFLIPAYTLLDQVNAVSGNGSLGLNIEECTAMWGHPPSFLLVDYYNYGNFNGSVFQVAADVNNVTYNRVQCCGTVVGNAARGFRDPIPGCWLFGIVFLLAFIA